jgi:hypothetical protein
MSCYQILDKHIISDNFVQWSSAGTPASSTIKTGRNE